MVEMSKVPVHTEGWEPREMSMENYLVRVNSHRFLMDVDGVNVTVTDTPSNSRAFAYSRADSLVRRLRARGFPQAVVTDLVGVVMTYDRLKSELRADFAAAEAGKTQDDLPNTLKELSRIPVQEQRRRYKSDRKFAKRVDALEAGKS
jgi:hypothetical protein